MSKIKILLGCILMAWALVALNFNLATLDDADYLITNLANNNFLTRNFADFQHSISLPSIPTLGLLAVGLALGYYLALRQGIKDRRGWILAIIIASAILMATIWRMVLGEGFDLSIRLGAKIIFKWLGLIWFWGGMIIGGRIIYRHFYPHWSKSKQWWIAVGLVIITLEVLVFNFRFYESFFWQEQKLENAQVGASLHHDGLGFYSYLYTDNTEIEYLQVNEKIKNIRLNFASRDGQATPLGVTFYLTDEGTSGYYPLPQQVIVTDAPTTQFFRLHPSGKSEKIKFDLEIFSQFSQFQIVAVVINQPVPFNFSWGRIGIMTVIAGLYFILKKTKFYRIQLDLKKWQQKIAVGGVLIVTMILIWQAAFLYERTGLVMKAGVSLDSHTQYQALTEALVQGKFSLGEIPELMSLSNPYDPQERREAGINYPFDTAYFAGKYYTYFGITPVLLFYLPFYLLTGWHLTNSMVVIIFAWLMVIGVYYWLYFLIKEKFKQVSLTVYLILANLIIFSSGFLYVVREPFVYQPPVMAATSLTILGLGFYQHYRSGGRGKVAKVALGSICLTLVAGCRPQLLLVGALAICYYFGRKIKNKIWRKENKKIILALGLPFLIGGSFFAYHNYARFGSPLEFGAIYNLTRRDYSHHDWALARVGPAIFTYFLRLPVIEPVFPFLASHDRTDYLGDLYQEPTYGGLFWCYPWLAVLLWKKGWKKLKRQQLWQAPLGLIIAGIIICILDVQMMGITVRYGVDFSFLFGLAGTLMILINWRWIWLKRKWFFPVVLISLIMGILLIFAHHGGKLFHFDGDASRYHTIARLIQWWL